MATKPVTTIVNGFLVLVVTYQIFTLIFNSIAPSEAEILAAIASEDPEQEQMLYERSEQAKGIRSLFYAAVALEVIATGVLVYKGIKESNTLSYPLLL